MPIDLDEYAVLAMNTYTPNEQAVLIDFHGLYYIIRYHLINLPQGYSKRFYFSIGNQSEVHRSCSVLYKNEMIVFGGYDIPTQVYLLEESSLKFILV